MEVKRSKRLVYGSLATGAWLLAAVVFFFVFERPTKLNEWGDAFAGFFAPLAFLWLVLGYLQQGEELKYSTEALKLQAAELKNSVEQQSQLVLVAREQMAHEREKFERETALQRDAARPKFFVEAGHSVASGAISKFFPKLVNRGAMATKVLLSFDPPLERMSSAFFPMIDTANPAKLELRFVLTEPSTVTVDYTDATNLPGQARFTIQNVNGSLQHSDVLRVL